MKKIIVLSLLLMHFKPAYSQSGWIWIYPFPANKDIYSLQFINSSTGYAAAGNCIIKTTNGGINWSTFPTDNIIMIQSLHFIDQNTGYAAGYDTNIFNNGRVIKSTNGGLTWLMCDLIAEKSLKSIRFINNQTGFAAGYGGYIYKTINGGNYWSMCRVDTNTIIYDICNSDANNIFTAGTQRIYKSSDGGLNWIEKLHISSGSLYSVYFTNSITGYSGGTYFYQTTNSGDNWNIKGNSGGKTFCYLNSNVFYTGYDWFARKSTNSGLNWINISGSGGPIISSIYFINENTGFLGGYFGYFSMTTNGGNIWNKLQSNDSLNFTDVYFYNSYTGFISCSKGRLIKTLNSGNNWTTYNTGFNYTLNAVHTPDGINIWAVGNNILLNSTNSGLNWLSMYPNPNGVDFYDVQFLNKDTGFVTSNLYTFKTTSGGWDWMVSPTLISPRAIYFIDKTTGYACGTEGKVSKTTNCGVTWTIQNTNVTNRLNSIYFADYNTGYAVGDYKTIIRTTNGGSTWLGQSYSVSNLRLYSILFTNTLTGYISGEINPGFSIILKTINGGQNWYPLNCPMTSAVYTNMYFINSSTGFFVGGNALIKTTNAGEPIGFTPKKNGYFPNQFILKQNYPNPFNPYTAIEFDIPELSYVKLVIFDELGRVIEELVNSELSAGVYNVEWNATDYPSGIYYYRLQANDYSLTRKMVLIK